ncbi:MAG: sigma 54-interacting transcriptional regulator [Aquabacterium sp.]|nr:sigma 54-interacting transcriptional regulator [Aquabacterium sp.]
MKSPEPRISLAEAARRTGALLRRGDPMPGTAAEQPCLEDITECLFFSPGDGRIWLNDQRMVLMHTRALGGLRRELIDTLGLDRARGLLTRAGYESGARDAQLVRERWPDAELVAAFMAGTRLHALEGVARVVPVEFEIDPERGHYFGEFLLEHAMEDDEHISAYGLGTEPACWMQTGYATGYVTGMMGRLVIFREVECRTTGSSQCRAVGKTAEAWGDISEDLRYLHTHDFPGQGTAPPLPQAVLGSGALASDASDQMVGVSSAFKAACHMLQRVAPTKAAVLFTGESGVGKEMFASMLHRISPRCDQPFVAVNCAAVPETLIESELFGVERGAFTGANVSRPGRFERADKGTLFLDEIGTLSLTSQGKLLRALQQSEIERVGGTATIKLDVRVIAATNVDLRAAVKAGQFREDLLYRLDVYPIHLPPLRERREDIPLLMSHFLQQYTRLHGRSVAGFTPRAVKLLLGYPFPGNIRELQNMVERGVISAEDGGVIDLPHLLRREQLEPAMLLGLNRQGGLKQGVLDAAQEPPAAAVPLLDRLADSVTGGVCLPDIERDLIRQAVQRAQGNLSAAARLLGISRAKLAYRLASLPGGTADDAPAQTARTPGQRKQR